MDRADEVDPARPSRGVDTDRRAVRGAGFIPGEPGIALLGQAAERVPTVGAGIDGIDFHRPVAFHPVPVGDLLADVFRREADLPRFRGLRQ